MKIFLNFQELSSPSSGKASECTRIDDFMNSPLLKSIQLMRRAWHLVLPEWRKIKIRQNHPGLRYPMYNVLHVFIVEGPHCMTAAELILWHLLLPIPGVGGIRCKFFKHLLCGFIANSVQKKKQLSHKL